MVPISIPRVYLFTEQNRENISLIKFQWKVKVFCSVVSDSEHHDYRVLGILQARTLEWVDFPFCRGSSQPRSPVLQVDSLPAEPRGKPKNTGVGILSLLQWIFLTQGLNHLALKKWTASKSCSYYTTILTESVSS